MTNMTALVLGLIIVVFLIINFVFGLDAHIFLGRKMIELTDWLAFWR
ncbi:MAG: hypothetical protein AAFN59_04700 [Pseudomonadota bacterium]